MIFLKITFCEKKDSVVWTLENKQYENNVWGRYLQEKAPR